jgi:hypothetical protein
VNDLKFSLNFEGNATEFAKAAASAFRDLRTELGATKDQTGGGHGGGKGWFHELYDSEVIRRAFTGITSGLREMGEGFKALDAQKVLSGATEGAAGLAETLDLVNPILGESVAGVVKLAGSVAGLTVEIASFALEVTNTNDRIRATFGALGGAGAGSEMLSMVNELATRLPQSREQIADWAKEIQALGINDIDKVRAQTAALASAQAIMGESGVSAYLKLTEKIRLAEEGTGRLKLQERKLESLFRAGIDVQDVASKMGMSVLQLQRRLEAGTINAQRFGDAMESSILEKGQAPLEVMMRSLDTMKRKWRETFGHLFDDINATPLTDALQSVIELGDQGEASGQTLKDGITSGVNAIIKEFAHLTIRGEVMFLKLELWWLRTGLSIDGIRKDFHDLGDAIGIVLTPVMYLAKALGFVADQYDWLAAKILGGAAKEIGQRIFEWSDAAADAKAYDEAYKRTGKVPQLPGHAEGGMVTSIHGGVAQVSAAPGEGLASVGRGERILPAEPTARQVPSFNMQAFAGMTAANMNAAPASHSIHIGEIHVTGPQGVTHAQEVTVTGLALALERLQLASGR